MKGLIIGLCFLEVIFNVYGQQQLAPVFNTLATTGIDGDLKRRLVTQGVSEATTPGTFLGQLSAYVPNIPNAVVTFSAVSQTLEVTTDGRVTLKVAVDRERASTTGNNLFVTFKATYQGVNSDTSITISVIDINDNPPVFSNLPYSAQPSEDTSPGTDIFSGINVTDADVGDHAEISLTCIVDPNDAEDIEACNKFGVRTIQRGQGVYTGVVFLKPQQTLDYEAKKGYIMKLLATDNPVIHFNSSLIQNTATVNILINVDDRQDSPPKFLSTPITLFMYENAAQGTRLGMITAQDGDEGSARPIFIRSLDTANLFDISNATLEPGSKLRYRSSISVKGNVDREAQQSRYEFLAEAIELDQNGSFTDQRVTTQIVINIIDEDDNIPTFGQSFYNVTMLELDSVNTVGSTAPVSNLNIRVTDPDDATNAQFTIAIISQPYPGVFSITPTSATQQAQVTMIVNQPARLDYEDPNYRVQEVRLQATDVRNSSRSSTTTVRINLEDINDNSPQFSIPSQTASFSENDPIGHSIITITASDRDSGSNGQLTYSLRGTGINNFNIDPTTGYISLAQKVDFESTPTFSLLFVAKDQGSSPRESVIPLTINVLDYNDFGPVFNPATYRTTIRENEVTLLIPVKVQATDAESGSNIRYDIVAGNTADNAFVLDSITGDLTLSRGLNFEETPNRGGIFTLTVQATDADSPPQRTNTSIIITILDQNNHEPVFNPSSYVSQISEVAPLGSVVKELTATDADFGSNGEISYYIWSGGQDDFTVDANGRVLVSDRASLDVDTVGIYNITIHARDQGSPPKTGTATLRVTLTDANNKNPFFTEQVYLASVQESVPLGTSVLQVSARDPDSSSSLTYSIQRSSISARNSGGDPVNQFFPFDYREAFEIESGTGLIKVKTKLDRDSAAEIDMTVVVQDNNAEDPAIQTATTTCLITILGSADLTPYFAPPWTPTNPVYFYTLPEEMPIDSTITTLIATDPDGPRQIRNFEIIPGSDAGNFFAVNRTSGQLRINRVLDYENLNFKRVFLRVRATTDDNTRSITANITVQIQDINDNKPDFYYDRYDFTIGEDRRYPSQVGTVFATDRDSGSYASIQYTLSGQNSQDFTILPQTNSNEGIIIVSDGAVLDYESIREYKLTIQALDNPNSDASQVKNSVTRPLSIRILDINDNKPNFTLPVYNFYTVESFDIGHTIGQVRALDKDGGLNGEIEYSFSNISTDAAYFFGIDATEGFIYSKNNLEGASVMSPFSMKVRARDQGQPVQFNEVFVNINVSSGQLDNGQPVWLSPRVGTIITNIREDATPGTFVYTAVAYPRTTGARAIYSFLPNPNGPTGADQFTIDPNSGNITVTGTLDRETQENFDLILLATDSLNGTLQSTRLLTVRLQDVDDQLPSFKNCPNKQYDVPEVVNIQENEPVGTFVFKAQACDLDSGLYNRVQYGFHHPVNDNLCFVNVTQMFTINDTTGDITTRQVLDREQQESYLLCIKASPGPFVGRRKRYTEAEYREKLAQRPSDDQILYLMVKVTDINDQGPSFPPAGDLYTYVFDLPDKDLVYTLTATDSDSGDNGRIRYYVDSIRHKAYDGSRDIPVPKAFVINSDSGQLSVGLPSYKAFTNGYFVVTIGAEDYQRSELRDTETIKIYVAEELNQVRVTMTTRDDTTFVNSLMRDLERVTSDTKFIQTQIRYHKTATGTVSTQTDICMLVIRGDTVSDSYSGTNVLETSRVLEVLRSKGLGSPSACEPATTRDLEGWSAFWWVLVAFAIFMFVITLILMCVVWFLYENYKSYMESKQETMVPQ